MRDYIIEQIEKSKIIAIVRGIEKNKILNVAEALYEGGIRLMEITFNQKNPEKFPDTTEAIKTIAEEFEGRMLVGAGTVTTPELVEMAADAGAKYIISPDTNLDVIRRTLKYGLVSIPGAMTPTEIMAAHNAGADFVKLFPSGNLGVDYIKAIRAPISHIRLLAVGGINENNIRQFLDAGMCGAGIGSNLVNGRWIENAEYDKITNAAKMLVSAISK
ncbi:MAG TPA: bifunctional 4-hydroxy-2-oxoglutarate aldolase/2-dehydro-3-deoxy-phosphogluconate aldolase [Clostridia bacterium]